MHSTLHLNGSTSFKNNSAASGGGMYIGDSTVDTDGSNCFMNNMANFEGGGTHATESTVKFNGNDLFVANKARSRGAAISLAFTTMIFQGDSSFVNNSAKYGGGVHCEGSNLIFVQHGSSHFLNNTALRGGAQYFDLHSNLSLYQTTHVNFQENHAIEFGGAIYMHWIYLDLASFFLSNMCNSEVNASFTCSEKRNLLTSIQTHASL